MLTFLTDEWITALVSLRADYSDRLPTVPYCLRLNLTVTAVPFSPGTLELRAEALEGALTLHHGHAPECDFSAEITWELLRKIVIDGDVSSGIDAFAQKLLTVDGALAALVQVSIPANDASRELMTQIRAVTA